ncbi:MAG: hypothetical protein U0800_02875 [Isosphaeraceae bacterium]
MDPDRAERVGTIQQDDEVGIRQAIAQDLLEWHSPLDGGGIEERLVAAIEQDVGELPGDALRIGPFVADERLARFPGEAEGLEVVADHPGLIPLRPADRPQRGGDVGAESGDVANQGEDHRPHVHQGLEGIEVLGLAFEPGRPPVPGPDQTATGAELAEILDPDGAEATIRVEVQLAEAVAQRLLMPGREFAGPRAERDELILVGHVQAPRPRRLRPRRSACCGRAGHRWA